MKWKELWKNFDSDVIFKEQTLMTFEIGGNSSQCFTIFNVFKKKKKNQY